MMESFAKLGVDLEAKDAASPTIERVMVALDNLKAKWLGVAGDIARDRGLEIPIEAFEKTVNQVMPSVVKTFERAGDQIEADQARMFIQLERLRQRDAHSAERALERQANAARVAADRSIAETERVLERQANAARVSADRSIAETQRFYAARANLLDRLDDRENDARSKENAAKQTALQHQAEAARRAADASIAQTERHIKTEAIAARSRADASITQTERMVAAEKKSRSESAFIAQEANQKIEASDRRKAEQAIQAAERIAQANRRASDAHIAGMGGIASPRTMAGGLGGLIGAGGRGIGGIAGMLGGAMESGFRATSGAVSGLTSLFGKLGDTIGHAGGRVGEFLAVAVGLYSLHQIVNMIERAFHTIGGAITGFQDKMTQVESLRIGEGLKTDFDDLKAGILETSMATGRSATELGNALFFIEGHSYKGADALLILDKAAKLAASGLGETDQLVRIVTGQMVAYGAKASEAGHFFDVFAKTEQTAALPIGELSGQFQRLTPVAAALGIPIEHIGAAISTISQTGLGASRVVTDLAGVLNSFIHATPMQQKALESIGYPLKELREDLADPSKGLIAVLQNVWERSSHDINAAGEIFSDRSRALVGFLALIRNSGEDLNDTFNKFANTAGTVDAIFEINQQRMSLQFARMTAIAQAYGIMLTNELAPQVGHAMGQIADAFAAGDISGGFEAMGAAASTALQGMLTMLDNFAKEAFGGAYNIAAEIANGLWQGAVDAIDAVVNAIADMIASFLLGGSWTRRGPLSAANGDAGVKGFMSAYAGAMKANEGIVAGAATNVATAVNAEMAKIGAGGGSKEGLQAAIAGIDAQLLPWKLAIDSIKDSYEALIHPLDAQITAIQRIKDLEYERKQLKFEERDLELRMLKIRAEGDPMKRAQLAGQLDRLQEIREQHSIQARLASLNREARELKPGKGTSAQEIALRRRGIADEIAILNVQKQQHALVNVNLLGQYGQKKAILDVEKDMASINHSAFELEQKKTLQPLLEQRDALKAKMQAELDVIKLQTDGLEDQRRILEAQLKIVTQREAANKKAAGGGAAIPWKPDEDPFGFRKTAENAISGVSGAVAKTLKDKLEGGLREFARDYGPGIGQSLIGFVAGGMVGGLPGAIAGAALVPKLLAALADRGVTGEHFTYFANSVMAELRNSFGRAGDKLRVGDLLGTVESLMEDVGVWIRRFQTAFFSEWHVATQGGPGGSEVTYTRHTGIGRQIVEGIAGGIIDEPLDFAKLDEAVRGVFTRVVEHLTVASIASTDAAGEQTLGPSIMGKAFGQIGASISAALTAAMIGINQNLPGASAGAYSVGETIGDALFDDLETALDKGPSDNIIAAATRAGVAIGGAFLAGFVSKIPVIGGMVKFAEWLNTIQMPDPLGTHATFEPRFQPAGTGLPTSQYRAPKQSPSPNAAGSMLGANMLAPPDEVATVGLDAANGILAGFRDAWASDTSFKSDNAAFWQENVVNTSKEVLRTTSPSQVFREIGEDVLAGFSDAISGDATVGATVRMFLRSEVIANARSILLVGEGKSGGLPGVAQDALDAFAEVFATPPAGLSASLSIFGRSIVTDIMTPIKDPRTGIVAQVREVFDSIPKAPTPTRRAPSDEGGGNNWGGPNVMAATGADFLVGGSGGTDSEHLNLWATPGERVRVGSGSGAGGARNISNTFNINVNGGDPTAVRDAVAAGIQEGLGDSEGDVPNQLLNAWRTAKAQGAARPIGTQARGSRG